MAAKTKPAAKPKRRPGRPSLYTPELGETLCEVIASCTTPIHVLCETDDRFPHESTLYVWESAHPEFFELRASAMKRRAQRYIQEGVGFLDRSDADSGMAHVKKGDAQFKARVMLARSIDPETWGERRRTEHSGPGGGPIPVSSLTDLAALADAPE